MPTIRNGGLSAGGRQATNAQSRNNDDGGQIPQGSQIFVGLFALCIYTTGSGLAAMRVQRMISLDAETAEIASKMENFSMWVRSQLLKVKNSKNKRRFKYTCHVCDYNFHVSSIEYDNFFYCPNYMRDKNCDNTETLDGVEY